MLWSKQSGKLATSECKNTYTEYFAEGNIPDKCDGHVSVKICKESKKVANQYCPETETKYYTAEPEKEAYGNWKTQGASSYEVPTEECTIHNEETNKITVTNVVGKTEAQAKTALAGLNIQVIYEHHSDQADGVVIRQSLAEGTKVDKGVTIVITVNQVTTTPPSGGNTEDPTTPPEEPEDPNTPEEPEEPVTPPTNTENTENTQTPTT